MTIDHFARMVSYFHPNLLSNSTLLVFQIIGRISFPIFAFLVVESMIHTRNRLKYLFRLLFLAIICDLSFYLVSNEYWGNPITTLFLGGLFIYLFENKKWYIKCLSILPILYVILISFEIIPLYSMYDLYGFILIILFYLSEYLTKVFCNIYHKIYQIDQEAFYNKYSFLTRIIINILLLIIFNILIWMINPCYHEKNIFIDDPVLQLYSLLAIPFLIIYNGKKGYNKEWIKYLFYLYFPLHLIVLYLFMII